MNYKQSSSGTAPGTGSAEESLLRMNEWFLRPGTVSQQVQPASPPPRMGAVRGGASAAPRGNYPAPAANYTSPNEAGGCWQSPGSPLRGAGGRRGNPPAEAWRGGSVLPGPRWAVLRWCLHPECPSPPFSPPVYLRALISPSDVPGDLGGSEN